MDGAMTTLPDVVTRDRPPPTALPITPIFVGEYAKVITGIIGVMRKVKEVRKEGWNKEGKYGFVENKDLTPLLQDALAIEKITIGQREISRIVLTKILMISYQFDIWHADGGVIFNIGSHTGACRFEFKSGSTDDKAANKCFVAAAKYFNLQMFKIAPDDNNAERDPDAEGMEEEPRRRDSDRERDERPRRELPSARDSPPPVEGPPPGPPDDIPLSGPHDDGPPQYDAPPPGDDMPFGTGSVSPPPQSPGEVGFREKVMGFKLFITETAKTEDEAHDHWRANADLVRQCADTTYDYLRVSYQKRWGIYPPAV